MARVVITMEGGLIQHIMSDQEGIESWCWTLTQKAETTSASRNSRGRRVYVFQGVDDVDPDRVDEIETALFK